MPESAVVRTMRRHKADLAAAEQRQMEEMARRWLATDRRLDGQMTALAYEMTAITESGGTVTPAMLANQRRYQELLISLRRELDRYTDYAERTITNGQAVMAAAAIEQSQAAIAMQAVGIAFDRLPVSAVEHMVGLTGAGTPLRTLLVQSWPLSAQGLTQALVEGVALGYNPRKTAKNMAQGATGSLNRMMVISRNETLRVYREVSRQSYVNSGIVIGVRRLCSHDRRTCSACLLDEGNFYPLDQEMPEHVQGRCVGLPVIAGAEPIQWLAGEDWFMEQDGDTQESILGKGTYEAWRLGQIALQDLVTVKRNAVWGDSLAVTPLKELV
jgi:hypothetical protein